MSFLPAESRSAFDAVGHDVDEKLSRVKSNYRAETSRFRQAVYINWAIKRKKMPDPCGPERGYEAIVSYFVYELINEHNSRSGTVRGYLNDINDLFDMRDFPIPADFKNKQNMSVRLFEALKEEEDVAKQRDPITTEIFALLKVKADEAGPDSAVTVVFEWFCLIKIMGLRAGEYAQRVQTKVEIHEYPVSGKKVVKAFVRND